MEMILMIPTAEILLPLTGGSGAMIVTAIGIGLAVLSLLLFVFRGKPDDKNKKKPRR